MQNSYSRGRLPGGPNIDGGRPQGRNVHAVVGQVTEDPSTSVRVIERRTGIPKSTAHRILKKLRYHPYHVQKVQSLLSRDYAPRVAFCRRMLQLHNEDPNFFNRVLWSDESVCKKDGYTNLHNLHSWQLANPHLAREERSQYQFKINLWTGIVNGKIVGPVELPATLNAENYLQLLKDTLPGLLEEETDDFLQSMWLQNDGCPAHYARDVSP